MTDARPNVFAPFLDVAPDNVRVAVFGRDAYPCPSVATGRAFEQGDLTDWAADLATPFKVRASLRTLALAAVATALAPGASSTFPAVQRAAVRRVLAAGKTTLPPPDRCFRFWAEQGVLWVNRTPTYSGVLDQSAHQALWRPFTERLIEILVEQAAARKLVFALWGDFAVKLVGQHRRRSLPPFLQVCTAAHPAVQGRFFAAGNPLAHITAALGDDPIRWCPLSTERTGGGQ